MLQFRARLSTETPDQDYPRPAVCCQRLAAAAAQVQSRDQLSPPALAQRFGDHPFMQAGEDAVVIAKFQQDVGQCQLDGPPLLHEAGPLGRDLRRIGKIRERRGPPAVQRPLKLRARRPEPGALEHQLGRVPGLPEPGQVQVAGGGIGAERAIQRGQAVGRAQGTAGAADADPQRGRRVSRRAVTPQHAHQHFPAARIPGEQQQHRHERPLAETARRHKSAVTGDDLQRP